jgi:hypothetical protein
LVGAFVGIFVGTTVLVKVGGIIGVVGFLVGSLIL